MNILDALEAAKTEARGVAGGVAQCPLAETGLFVLVFGGMADDALSAIAVTVGANTVTTDDHGIARFVPLAAGDYTARAALPDPPLDLATPEDERVTVVVGERAICTIHLPTTVLPQLRIVWAHDDSPVPGVQLELGDSGTPAVPTDGMGLAAWATRLRPSRYRLTARFPDGVDYLVFQGDAQRAVSSIRLERAEPVLTLKIKRLEVKFRIQRQVGAALEELAGARVRLQAPALEGVTALDAGLAIATFVFPVTANGQPTECGPFTLVPDATDDVYEVVDVTSA